MITLHIAKVEIVLTPPDETVRASLRDVLHRLTLLQQQGETLMADVASVKQLVADLDAETNAVAARIDAQTAAIQALKDQIAQGSPVTQADLDAIAEGLEPISARLKTLGSNPDQPIPPA